MEEPKKSNKTMWIIVGIGAGVLLLCCCPGAMIGLLLPAVQKVRDAAERAQRAAELSQIGMSLHSYQEANKRMPASFDELKPLISDEKIKELVRTGEIEVVWKAVNINDDDRGSDKVLVGWNAKTDANGNRLVLFLDGSVQTITDAEFQNMPRVRTVGEKKQNKK